MTIDNGQNRHSAAESLFTDQEVLYLDFLGVSAAATTWNEDRASGLINLLKDIRAASGQPVLFGSEANSDESAPDQILIKTEISTFSDHIVVSCRAPQWAPFGTDVLKAMHLSVMRAVVGRIATAALKVGLLVRGGLTIGKLFHANGVVFGEGMIDAHRLESTVATVPRVVVSSRVYADIPAAKRKALIQDKDGIWHLDYFTSMYENVPSAGREAWIANCKVLIEQNILDFERLEKWNEYAKWSWFKKSFLTALEVTQ